MKICACWRKRHKRIDRLFQEMNTQPLITVLMPVYNAASFLREAIDSVLQQTYRNFEFLIINDGSSDESEGIILSYKDERIRYVKNESNLKLIATLNKGLELAKGKYIARMDADDICLQSRLEKQVALMEEYPAIGVCGTCAETFGSKKVAMRYDVGDEHIRVKMLYRCNLLHPSVIMRKAVIDHFGLRYNPEFIHAEDYDLFYRIGKVAKYANIPEVLMLYRDHAESVSRLNKPLQRANSALIIKKQFADLGIEITDAEIELYRNLMNSQFEINESELRLKEKLLLKIIEANRTTHFIRPPAFEKILFEKWKSIVMNTTHLGMNVYRIVVQSSLLRYGSFTPVEKIKFFVKALLKIKTSPGAN